MQLAVEAFDKGLFISKAKCANAFDVAPSTFKTCLNGVKPRGKIEANSRKLSDTEELTLKKWILDMDSRDFLLTIASVRRLAELLLAAKMKPSKDPFLSDRWMN